MGQRRRGLLWGGSGRDAPTVSADLHNNRHIFCTAEDARLVPGPQQIRQDARLLDQLVGAGEECGRNAEAQRFRSFKIDHELESRGCLDG